ncbi:hypothetical protein HPB47_017709 [Ixodes persulcatus]|uniref:Uncharacterized protein n=1 Tax=Ixodes persulcatus TaxID=34615 RepID=A0AC60QMR2_IXOPE|nr:hypothetical protein HPB47_017709 [Ixodes persulcatus]
MATATPSLTASQKTPTERYSMPPSTCGSSIAELENEASVTNLAEVRAPDHGLHISPPNAEILTSDMEIADTDQGEWYDAKTSKKRKKNFRSSKSGDTVTNSPTTTVGLTVIFVPAVENQKITAISSLKLSVALEQLCPECIHEIRPNSRLNLIAVDTRNGQTTRALLACTQICSLKVRAYEPVPRHFAVGVIKDVDTSLSDAEIEQHMRSPEGRVARIRRLGQSSIVKIAFSETTLPSFVYLGHVRHPVTPFKERPIQCRKCCGYGHREANCKRPPICSRCGEAHDGNDTCSGQEKCANCSQAHAATSSSCPKWQRESETRSYARKHAVDFRAARSAVSQQRETKQTAEIEQRPLHSQNTINETSNKQNPSAHGYAAALKKNQQKLMKGAPPSNDRKTQVLEPKGEKERPSTSAAATPDPMRKTTSTSDAPPIKGNAWESWIPLLKKAARMAYSLLSSAAGQLLTRINMASGNSGIIIWQWNCRGFAGKKAVLQQHIRHAARKPDVILLQETLTDAPTLMGYREHVCTIEGRGLCTLVRKGLTFVDHELGGVQVEHSFVELIPTKHRKQSIFVLNVYSNPSNRRQRFRALLQKALKTAGTAKGRNLTQDTHELDFALITDPAHPTRLGNSATRDTTPDLTFVRNAGTANVTWSNTTVDLGSDHAIIEIHVPTPDRMQGSKRTFTWTDWEDFRKQRDRQQLHEAEEITDIEAWSRALVEDAIASTKTIETDVDTDKMDSRLAHLIEAKNSILARWTKQRLNRRLRKKVAELNRSIEEHCRTLNRQQWDQMCNAVDGQLHNGKAWSLLKHLLDATNTKSHQRDHLARLIHKEIGERGKDLVAARLRAKYLPETPTAQHGPYKGEPNEELDRGFSVEEIRTAQHELNSRSAPGPDGVSNRALKNLDDRSMEQLTDYINTCWQRGSLPRQWKTAKMILIPKTGKPPSLDNLRPISLTSCVGKVIEHALLNRWQVYLEQKGIYPPSLIGFRQHLGTQDAMLQLKHQVLDNKTRGTRAILGLDLESAFDKVVHSAILRQISQRNLGLRTYNFVKDFLTDRRAVLVAKDLQLEEQTLGSVGTPQGSVISPTLFNLVMIGVAEKLQDIEYVRHTIYADDITLWVHSGSDGHIESTLQSAIDAIEAHLQGTGLRCSPKKSELLLYRPAQRGKLKARRNCEEISLRTSDGTTIPTVPKIRVLGMIIEATGHNGGTITRLVHKTSNATRLLKRIANRRSGMREENLTRLIHSFVVCHIAYVAAFHNWYRKEEDKINVLIRRVYKSALGLPESTGTDRLFQLGIHNTLNEIAEAQCTSQLERLSGTNVGNRILENLGIGYHTQQGHKVTIPVAIRQPIRVDPIPRNVHPEYNRGRREAQAKALLNAHSNNVGILFVDAAEYERGSRFAVTEIAVALALTDPACKTVLCDSRQVIRNFAKGRISLGAARIISQHQVHREPEPPTRLLWFPAHVGEVSEEHRNGNETAHARARELTSRTGDSRPWYSSKDRMTSYNEITKAFRLARRTLPPLSDKLDRAQAVALRQLQTRTPSLDDQLWAVQQACEAVKRQDFDVPRRAKRTSGNAPKRVT